MESSKSTPYLFLREDLFILRKEFWKCLVEVWSLRESPPMFDICESLDTSGSFSKEA